MTSMNYADPCCTVLFSILVLHTTKSTVVRATETLMSKAILPDSTRPPRHRLARPTDRPTGRLCC